MVKSLKAFTLGAATTALVASVAFLVVPSLGGSGSSATQFISHHHGVTTKSAIVSASSGTKVQSFEYKGTAPPGKEDGSHFTCPSKTPHAVSGYFLPEKPEQAGKVQFADSFPSGKGNKNWDVGVFNPTTDPQTYFVGVVCIK